MMIDHQEYGKGHDYRGDRDEPYTPDELASLAIHEAQDAQHDLEEPYCDYCERDGHTFRSCPKRDDESDDEYDLEPECSCGDATKLYPLLSMEELRDPECPLHGRA